MAELNMKSIMKLKLKTLCWLDSIRTERI